MKKILLFIMFFCFGFNGFTGAAMTDYCVIPPFNSAAVKPNIMIVMDFSGSMQFPAYIGCTFYDYDGYVAMCAMPSSGTSNYVSTNDYYGFADKDKYYIYQSSGFQVNSSCTSSYANKIGGPDCISGNILNWITSTRIDVARKVLTGGRTSTGASDKFESEGANFKYMSSGDWWHPSYSDDWYTDTSLQCKFNISANATSNRKLNIANRSGYTCALGTLSDATIKVKMESASEATGIVHDFYDKVHFEFMVYSTGSGAYDRQGVIKSGKDATMSSLIAAINNETPYWGTPTGEALWEAYDFFKQANDHNYAANNSEINKTSGNKDPFYDGTGIPGDPYRCRKAFVLLISDGAYGTSIDPVEPARTMRITDLRSDLEGTQNVTTYAVHAFSTGDTRGGQSLKTTAIFGGFDDNDSNTWPYPFTAYPTSYDSRDVAYNLTNCNPSGTWNASCNEWDKNRTGSPYNFFEADDGATLKTALMNALNDMLRRASSGTAASVLASSEGSGANLLQAVYYPKRLFTDTEIEWIGEIQNLWYYIDPFLQSTSIREDTNIAGTSGSNILNVVDDYVIKYYFDTVDNKTKAKRYSTATDGSTETYVDTVSLEDIKSLWEAGTLLFQRNLTTSPRTIYTTTNGSSFLTNNFSLANETTLRSYLQAAHAAEGVSIINFVHGIDQTGYYRSRTVTIGTTTGVWKLGDIVDSTPRLQSSIPANNYHLKAPDGYSDSTYLEYTQDSAYLNRGMVYAGANDGMLHAFKLGKLEQTWTSPTQGANEKARLTGSDLGTESWAFIPKNALPYLKYTADTSYCHLYFVDMPPLVIDTSVPTGTGTDISTATKTKASWKTIVIGGMGLGGANAISTSSCTNNTATGECVKTPITDPADSTKGLGYSSYFALNVTDPTTPSLLWEFSDPALGFSTSGPVIIRIGDTDKNGKWFAVFASGPTGPIYTTKQQFMGTSNQNLKLFILDLYTGSLLRTIDTSVTNAFAGSLYNAALDTEKGDALATGRYSDNVFYLGYTEKDTATSTWTKGGVLRVITKEDPDPANWVVSTVVNNIGPVTSAVTKLQDRKNSKLWLYFGSGRFFYRYDDVVDDKTNQRTLYGVMEPCYNTATGPSNSIHNTCTTSLSSGDFDDQTTSPSATLVSGATGWYVNLDASSGSAGAERVITDPLAVFSGSVFFTTYAPSTDICSLGGNTYIWCTNYKTGQSCTGLGGKAIIQVSTGAIQELSLSSVFSEKESRRTVAITGMPPKGQGLSVLIGPRPLRKILHIREK